jgi:hypothetical protein
VYLDTNCFGGSLVFLTASSLEGISFAGESITFDLILEEARLGIPSLAAGGPAILPLKVVIDL